MSSIMEVQPKQDGGYDRFVQKLGKIVEPLSKWGASIAAFSLTCMMILTFIDVAGSQIGKWELVNSRTNFFKPFLGGQEIVELTMVVLVAFGLSYCALFKGHIRVDLILQYVSQKATHWFDVFTYGISCLFYILIAFQSFVYCIDNIHDKTVSTILLIPIYPFNFLLFLGALLALLVFFRDFLKSIGEVRK